MNIRSCTLLLGVVALGTSGTSPALAGQFKAPGPHHANWAMVLEQLDTNKNQCTEVVELSARLQQLAQQADANHDGTISPEELRNAGQQILHIARDQMNKAYVARRQARRTVTIAKVEQQIHQALVWADADHNGELTRPEIRHAVHLAAAEMYKRAHEHWKARHAKLLSLLAEERSDGKLGKGLADLAHEVLSR